MTDDKTIRENLYHAALIDSRKIGVGTRSADRKLLKLFKLHGTFEGIYKHYFGGLFSDADDPRKIEGLEPLVRKLDAITFDYKLVTIMDEHFPEHMKTADASPVLYVRGNMELFNRKSIAVVGTREPDPVDFDEGRDVVERLVMKDYAVVSGLAAGCDTLAHRAAIAAKGNTIAVLGTPLNAYYPGENRNLQELIASEHLLVSQYPIGVRTFPSHFAHRNITTVSLSTDGIVVIRAGDESGTQHAIRQCSKQGKPIYALANNFGKGYKWVDRYETKIPNGK